MSLNNILIRPQILEQDLSPQDYRLVNVLLELGNRLMRDMADGGTAGEKVTTAIQESLSELLQEMEARVLAASGKIQAFFQPILDAFQALFDGEFENTTADVFRVIAGLLELAGDATEALMTEALELKLKELVAIIEVDLGFTQARVRALVTGLVDRAIDSLTSEYLAGNQDEEATRHFVIGTYFEQLRDALLEFITLPEFTFDLNELVEGLTARLRKESWDEVLGKIQEVVEQANSATEGIGKFMGGFGGKFKVSANTSASASFLPDPPSWYASWFYNDWGKDQVIGVTDRFDLSSEPFAGEIHFDPIGLDFMEHFAMVTSVLQDYGEAALHFASIESGDVSMNVINAILNLFKGSLSIGLHDTDDADWVEAYKWIGNWWIEHGASLLFSLVFAAESSHDRGHSDWTNFVFYATLLGKDVVENLMYNNWTTLGRGFFLSLFTLINHDKDAAPNALNKDQINGLSFLFAEGGVALAGLVGGWTSFGLPVGSDRSGWAFVGQWALGVIFGGAGGWLGALLGGGIAGDWASEEALADMTWKTSLLSFLKWPIYWYYIWNGDTNDGTRGKDRTTPNAQEVTFPGYPDHETSPYKMPYKKGDSLQGAQGNLGPWSHHWGTSQIYAVDFAHDHWTEVLAARGGVVKEFYDMVRDHDSVTDNNLTILHNDPNESMIPNPIHDKDHTGIVQTEAKYIHAAHYGIRQTFASRGIPEDYIIGTPVQQGMHVMFSGDTGMSAYNHLHFHISTEEARTIPFVFNDMPEKKGVLRDLTWYVSQNEKKDPFADIPLLHPPDHRSHILDTRYEARYMVPTNDKLELYGWNFALNKWRDLVTDDGAFEKSILIHNSTGQKREIECHEFEVREPTPGVKEFPAKIELKTPWTTNPSLGDRFTVTTQVRESGNNHVLLDNRAAYFDDVYVGQLIIVWWVDEETGNTIRQQRKIIEYNDGDRKARVDNNWDINPPMGADFAIGGQEFTAEANSFPKEFRHRFAYIAPYDFDADRSLYDLAKSQPLPGGVASKKLVRGAYYHATAHSGRIRANTTDGGNTVKLDNSASTVNGFYDNRFIMLYERVGFRDIPVYHRKITGYNGGNQTATLDRPLGKKTLSLGGDRYAIGGLDYTNETAENKQKFAFWGKDLPLNSHSPVNFGDGTVPYRYITFKGGQERRT